MIEGKELDLESIDENILHLLSQRRCGFECEGLRVSTEAKIAQSLHPEALGSALTHSFFTKDYSEALIEIITPPSHKAEGLQAYLEKLHTFVYSQIGSELLWASSMPCRIDHEDEVPLAYFGTSNRGRMKNIYRRGLKLRYGPRMQIIAGNHYNFSFSTKFWKFFHQKSNSSVLLQDFISDGYMRMARNFLRINPLLVYIFGATPAVDKSFLKRPDKRLERFDKDTYYLPYGTSLRLSDLGYKNPAQAELRINYNSLKKYIHSLNAAINVPSRKYAKFGVLKDGIYQQISPNLLQVDNEYYGMVRPKRKAPSSVMPIHTLYQQGVDYLEIRSLDLDPFSTTRVSLDNLHFLELILISCFFEESPLFDNDQLDIVLENHDRVILWGRKKGLKLIQTDRDEINFKTWALDLLNKLYDLALLLDQAEEASVFVQALEQQINKVENPDLTPSGKILQMMRSNRQSFLDFHLELAHRHKEILGNRVLSNTFLAEMKKLGIKSIEEQRQLEADEEKSFEEFLEEYLSSNRTEILRTTEGNVHLERD